MIFESNLKHPFLRGSPTPQECSGSKPVVNITLCVQTNRRLRKTLVDKTLVIAKETKMCDHQQASYIPGSIQTDKISWKIRIHGRKKIFFFP